MATHLEDGLRLQLERAPSVLVGYSGGVDSTYLAAVALDVLGPSRVLAVTGHSPSVPGAQRTQARAIAGDLGLPHLEVDTAEMADPRYVANPSNRCYFCKAELWRTLTRVASERGLAWIVDGANADDRADHRPGFVAAAEYGVRSPLLEAGLTKADIRALSRARGLPTWDQPAAPCLSSRIPYGLAVTPERLRQVEESEDALRALGFRIFRVRHHGDAARVEVHAGEMERAVARATAITRALRAAGFARVLLDAEGFRSGSLNEGLAVVQIQ